MSTQIPRLSALTTAVPDTILRQTDVFAAVQGMFAESIGDFERWQAVFENAAIDQRHSCMPLEWYQEPHDFGERNALYLEHAADLLCRVAENVLKSSALTAAEVDTLVTVSSTGIATPTLDTLLMARLPFRADVKRLPIFGFGCAGGVLGLARAAALARERPGSSVLFLVVELCGLTFRRGDRSKSNIVATALFGDGAAGALLSTAIDGPALTAWGEHTWSGTLDVMGWDVSGDGLSVIFSRDIPALIRNQYAAVLLEFLEAQGLRLADIDSFVAHPGGAKVLDALEEVFKLQRGGLRSSRRVLRRYGNMSAATVLFVLQEALRETDSYGGRSRRHLLTSLGPGFTAGFATLET